MYVQLQCFVLIGLQKKDQTKEQTLGEERKAEGRKKTRLPERERHLST